MNEKEVKKIVMLQERLEKTRNQINDLCDKYNTILYEELRPLVPDLLPNTLYMVDGIPYRLGDLTHGVDWRIDTRSIGVKALHAMRRPEKKKDAVDSYEAD